MGYRSYCDLCRESYDSDNLMTGRSCNRDFCSHCGDGSNAVCLWCLDTQRTGQPAALHDTRGERCSVFHAH
jgi:hypothetical protein